jgi:hypothetical protein
MSDQTRRLGNGPKTASPQKVQLQTLPPPLLPHPTPYLEQWAAVIAATHIVRAQIRSVQINPSRGRRYDDVNVGLDVSSYRKGEPIYGANGNFLVGLGRILKTDSVRVSEWKDRTVIVLVKHSGSQPSTFVSLAAHFDKAVLPATAEVLRNIEKEWENQVAIMARFTRLPVARPDAHHETVKQLIAQLTQERTQEQATEALQRTGMPGVPSLIRQMDDFRLLARPTVSVENDSQVFLDYYDPRMIEGVSHYRAKYVVDALSAILSYVTNRGLGTGIWARESKDVTMSQRERAIQEWRIFLFYLWNAQAAKTSLTG